MRRIAALLLSLFALAAPTMLPAEPAPKALAAYGPFRVLDRDHAALVGVTDDASPGAFLAMLRAYPGIATLEMAVCSGTWDDRANLRLGLMIRAKGIATRVPAGGWVASGAVDLFLAGRLRMAEPTAQFVVHAWQDTSGRGPSDYKANAPKNRAYLDYYRAIGMSERQAKAFYAMTNSVPFTGTKVLTRADLAHWVKLDSVTAISKPYRAPAASPGSVVAATVTLDSQPALQ
jgi:hypothetical protein